MQRNTVERLVTQGGSIDERVALLNDRYKHHSATTVLELALKDKELGRVALVSSFGAESVVLLHMISLTAPDTPIVFIDTQMLFPETISYQLELIEKLGLTNVSRITPDQAAIHDQDPNGQLNTTDKDACCELRKTVPLQAALEGYDSWISGRKRFQGATRAELKFFENEEDTRIKINPLAYWTPKNLQEYIENHRLPRHPLVSKGYPSIGCAPCTSPVNEGEDSRAGRWRGEDKTECGIHFVDGKFVKGPIAASDETTGKGDAA